MIKLKGFDKMTLKISIVGLGKLGATTLCVLASKGFHVVGVDINKGTVQKINDKISPIYEPGVKELLNENSERIIASSEYKTILGTDMTVIIVPTPSTKEGNFTTKYVEEVIKEIGKVLSKKKEYHNVVVTSTVLPGSMEEVIKPLLEKYSGKKVGKDIGLCYNPDFIAIGSIIKGLTNPDMILIGESDKKAGAMLGLMHNSITENEPTIHRMSFYNAELAKISLNAFVTMKISFANTIGEICEKMPTGNANHVLDAIGDDKRVGQRYLKKGLSYGGPCFPRDNRAFNYVSDKYRSQSLLSLTSDVVNKQQINRIVDYILNVLNKIGNKSISVLGLTYKPDSNLTEESAPLKIVQQLIKVGIKVKVYDPSFPKVKGIELSKSIVDCLKDSKVCFIATPWKEFKDMEKWEFIRLMSEKPIIIDAWGIQKEFKDDYNIDYREVGVND